MKAYLLLGLVTAGTLVVGVRESFGADNASTEEKALKNPVPNVCGVEIETEKWIEVNENDDDIDENWDKNVEPVPGEKNTLKITVTGNADKSPATVVVRILPDPKQKIEGFWPGTLTITGQPPVGNETDGKEKKGSCSNPFTFTVPAGKTAVQTLYIEGLKNSENLSDVAKIQATATAPGGTTSDGHPFPESKPPPVDHELLVYKVDIDIDSNNDQKLLAPARDEAEDKIEASEKIQSTGHKRPGKYLFVNGGFNKDNNDACPGWADGFDINPGSTCDNVAAVFGFTPVILELPEPFDPSKAEIEFDYEASDPAGVTFVAGGGTPTDPFTYTLAPGGKLRLWKKDGPGSRNKAAVTSGGDFVPRARFPWNKLGAGRTITLYLEAVRPSASLANILNIGVTATEGGVTCSDDIHVTSVYLENGAIAVAKDSSWQLTKDFASNRYTFSPDPIMGGGCGAWISASADFVPAGVDPYVFPMSEIKVSVVQNTFGGKKKEASHLFSSRTWLSGAQTGDKISYPEMLVETVETPQGRSNDTTGEDAAPLYANEEGISVGTPGAGPVTTNDSPSTGGGIHITWIAMNNTNMLAIIGYDLVGVTRSSDYVDWVVGYDIATKQVYPLAECPWKVNVISGSEHLEAEPGLQRGVTMVPVRAGRSSNDLIQDISYKHRGIAPGAIMLEETK